MTETKTDYNELGKDILLKKIISKSITYILLAIWGFIVLFPFY